MMLGIARYGGVPLGSSLIRKIFQYPEEGCLWLRRGHAGRQCRCEALDEFPCRDRKRSEVAAAN